ncbi:MAG TPA: glycosyltransferase family 2 protein [Verrucomicrobiae bacterium]
MKPFEICPLMPPAASKRARHKNGNGSSHDAEHEQVCAPSVLAEPLHELQRAVREQAERADTIAAKLEHALEDQDEAQANLDELREILTAKGMTEIPRTPYQQLVRSIRELVRKHVPHGATVAVVSKGDPELLRFHGRTGWHFPQQTDGQYAGFYPGSSLSAIAHLEVVRSKGADYFLLPKACFWWLDHYVEFRRFLENRYVEVLRDQDSCLIYRLRESSVDAHRDFRLQQLEELSLECEMASGEDVALLDWDTGLNLAEHLPAHRTVFAPPQVGNTLPYFDESVDIVAMVGSDPAREAEARRVARVAVLRFPEGLPYGQRLAGARLERKAPRAVRSLPSVSIVIPCHNALAYTKRCLDSLFETLPDKFEGEILVVDDASTDATNDHLKGVAKQHQQLTVFRNEQNLGFLRSCNRAARAATGEILLFLNNDTVLLPGWLTPLLQLLLDYPDAGAVGGKLLFPDGRLQEAGGLIFCDGSADHFGREDYHADMPVYNFVREVDYCSGALLAIRRPLFLELGCFDEQFVPGYYEDTDLCFAVRSRGYRVYYQPASVVVHFEGATAGNDLSKGPKRHQVINQAKFVQKWASALKGRPGGWDRREPLALLFRQKAGHQD